MSANYDPKRLLARLELMPPSPFSTVNSSLEIWEASETTIRVVDRTEDPHPTVLTRFHVFDPTTCRYILRYTTEPKYSGWKIEIAHDGGAPSVVYTLSSRMAAFAFQKCFTGYGCDDGMFADNIYCDARIQTSFLKLRGKNYSGMGEIQLWWPSEALSGENDGGMSWDMASTRSATTTRGTLEPRISHQSKGPILTLPRSPLFMLFLRESGEGRTMLRINSRSVTWRFDKTETMETLTIGNCKDINRSFKARRLAVSKECIDRWDARAMARNVKWEEAKSKGIEEITIAKLVLKINRLPPPRKGEPPSPPSRLELLADRLDELQSSVSYTQGAGLQIKMQIQRGFTPSQTLVSEQLGTASFSQFKSPNPSVVDDDSPGAEPVFTSQVVELVRDRGSGGSGNKSQTPMEIESTRARSPSPPSHSRSNMQSGSSSPYPGSIMTTPRQHESTRMASSESNSSNSEVESKFPDLEQHFRSALRAEPSIRSEAEHAGMRKLMQPAPDDVIMTTPIGKPPINNKARHLQLHQVHQPHQAAQGQQNLAGAQALANPSTRLINRGLFSPDLHGPFTISSLIVNLTIAGGISGDSGASLVIWLVAGIIFQCITACWVELGLSIPRHVVDGHRFSTPRSGGDKSYLEHLVQRPNLLISSVFGITFIAMGNLAGNAIQFGVHMQAVVNPSCRDDCVKSAPVVFWGIGALTLCALLNIGTRKFSIQLNNALAVLKISLFLITTLVGLAYSSRHGVGYQKIAWDCLIPHFGPDSLLTGNKHFTTHAASNFLCKLSLGNTNCKQDAARQGASFLSALFILGNLLAQTYTVSRVKQEIAKEGVLPHSLLLGNSSDELYARWSSGAGVVRVGEQASSSAALLHWVFQVLLVAGLSRPSNPAYVPSYIYTFVIVGILGFLAVCGLLYLNIEAWWYPDPVAKRPAPPSRHTGTLRWIGRGWNNTCQWLPWLAPAPYIVTVLATSFWLLWTTARLVDDETARHLLVGWCCGCLLSGVAWWVCWRVWKRQQEFRINRQRVAYVGAFDDEDPVQTAELVIVKEEDPDAIQSTAEANAERIATAPKAPTPHCLPRFGPTTEGLEGTGMTIRQSLAPAYSREARSAFDKWAHVLRRTSKLVSNRLSGLWQANPPPGYVKISWICRCGDILRIQVPVAQEMAAIAFAKQAAGPNSSTVVSQPSARASPAPSNSRDRPVTGTAGQNTGRPSLTPFSGNASTTADSTTDSYSTSVTTRSASSRSESPNTLPSDEELSQPESFLPVGTKKYMLLCVNTSGPRGIPQRKLANVDVTDVECGAEMFQRLRNAYYALRPGRNPFFAPKTMHYVKFQLLFLQKSGECIGAYEADSIPSRNEVIKQEYAFSPCPPCVGKLPLPPDIFMHGFLDPCDHLGPMAVEMLPKKLWCQLRWDARANNRYNVPAGWGFYIVEGINWSLVSWCTAVALIAVTALTVSWSVWAGDVQGGTGLGQYCLAVLTLAFSAWLLKYSVEPLGHAK